MTQNQSFVESLSPKTAFIAGFIAAILCLGTLGFVILGGCLLSGSCQARVATADSIKALPPSPSAADIGAAPAAPAGPIPVVTDDDQIRGNKDAKVTIIEYSDFECPFCERFHPTMQQVMADYPNDVRWVFRHYPLPFHSSAEPAANAAECAGEQGKFWELADKLFENQSDLGDDLYTQLAKDLGLNAGKFADCLSTGKFLNKIRAQAQAGAGAGVSGTPGSFVIDADGNAEEIKGAQPYPVLKQAIDAVLAR